MAETTPPTPGRDPSRKAEDVTGDFPTLPPAPPINSFLASAEVMKGAEDMTYLGRLTEAESKQLVTRSITMTRWTDMMSDNIANDYLRFGYESKAEFWRHGIEMLIAYLVETRVISAKHDGFMSDIAREQHALRLDAERARIRTELRTNITAFDDEMDAARTHSDHAYIADRLKKYRDLLATCNSETQRRQLREILAGSIATRSAVAALHQWVHQPYRPPMSEFEESWVGLADNWAEFFRGEREDPE